MDALAGALVAGAVALSAAVLGYFVNRRSVAVVELEAAMKRLVQEVGELRVENKELKIELAGARADLRQANAHIDALAEQLELLRKEQHP